MKSSADATAATLKLRPVLDLTAAEPLKADFMALRGRPLAVDASEVDRIGGLCLQVVLSARATWAAEKIPFRVAPTSDGFQETLATFGAADLILSVPAGATP